mmetsp:Transcript_136475/g.424057  ORF Transcript_136475/g.424057 Transcript_136475/m.424057 type:complete len:273 (-) Transcript_136475:968-1786(-)
MDAVARCHHGVREDCEPEHAHHKRDGVQVLLPRVVHVWDGHLHKELHGELQPLNPLHHQRLAALGGRRLHVLAALLLERPAEVAHPRVRHVLRLRAELQGDEGAQLVVVLVDMHGEVPLVPRGLAVEHILQGDDLPRRLLEAGQLQCGRPLLLPRRLRALLLGGLVEKRPRELGDGRGREGLREGRRLHVLSGPRGGLRLRIHKERLVHQAAVVPRAALGNSPRGIRPLESRAVLGGVDGGADQQSVVAQPHVALFHVAAAVHEAVADVHAH